MGRKTVRVVLALVAGLWTVAVYALSVGALEPEVALAQPCVTAGPEPVECPSPTPSPSGAPSGQPSGSATPSSTPAGQSTPTNSGSATPTPTQSSPSPSGSSPSPSPSGSTPPPPSVRPADSKITIDYANKAFDGKVTSESNKCEGRRRVKLMKVKRGKDDAVGRTRTDGKGNWKIRKPDVEGRFYAKVTRKFVEGGGNVTIRCNAARSRTIRP